MDCMAIFGILLLLNWIAAIRLRRCINDQYINIEEDSQDPVICDLDSNKTVTWYLSAENSPVPTFLGECGPSKTEVMCSSSYDNVVITRSAIQSNLTILRNHRDFSKNTVRCTNGHVDSGYSCQMRVVHRATPTMCNSFIHKEGNVAKVYGSCYIEKTFASDTHYSCIWHHRYPNQTGEPQPLASVFITTPYTEAGHDYVKSTCAFSSSVFTVNGAYKIYFSFNPGPDKQEIGTIDIPYTVDQWQTTTKPLTFPATGSNQLALTCNSASKIDPPIWSGTTCSHGNTGQTCTFTPDPSSDEGKIVTCSAYFPKQPFASTTVNASFKLNLTPPSAPVITGYQPGHIVFVGENLTMTCSVNGDDPLVTSVTFYCGSTADGFDKRNTTHVSSQVTISSVRADQNGTLCVCKALWRKDEQLELNRNVTLLVEEPPDPPVIAGYRPGQVFRMGGALTLLCIVNGGTPKVKTVTFFCGEHKDSEDVVHQTAVFSAVIIDSLSETDNGTVCNCSARWEKDSTISLTTSITLIVEGQPAPTTIYIDTSSKDSNEGGTEESTFPVAEVAGGIGAVIAIIIIVIVIIIFVRRLRMKTYDRPNRRRDQDTNPYTGLRPTGANAQGVNEEGQQLASNTRVGLQMPPTDANELRDISNTAASAHLYQNTLQSSAN